jgi:hypothetical protein
MQVCAGAQKKPHARLFWRRFSTQDTRPVEGRWCDALQVVDGHWAPDGCSLALADVAGQWHLYGVGAASFPAAAHLYDQFLASDYGPLVRDGGHFVLDADSQQPPHVHQLTCAPSTHQSPTAPVAVWARHRAAVLEALAAGSHATLTLPVTVWA